MHCDNRHVLSSRLFRSNTFRRRRLLTNRYKIEWKYVGKCHPLCEVNWLRDTQ